ncbi:MAG: HpcH/HpaI aldolase/citrate lyase family protein [Hominisplanchenecus sp.]|nr:HpcH/HpaI aldolase/citrate lyase family protein [Hominisplanchenecus sp.]
MKQNQYNVDFKFIEEPQEFDKHTEREQLAYCLGATLYMPALRNFAEIVLKKKVEGLCSMVVCFEDAVDENVLPQVEENAVKYLEVLANAKKTGQVSEKELPLMFFRVRSVEQFHSITGKLDGELLDLLTGFVFPKFSIGSAEAYFSHLRSLNDQYGLNLYAMPIIEGREVAFKETRLESLLAVKKFLDENRELVLNVRVGGTDFSSAFGVRRGVDYSIYDIMTVSECLCDILNVFGRDNEYVVSGPVWEYFLANKEMKFKANLDFSLQSSLLKRKRLVNEAIDGLLREVIIDRANGFVGKTVIHPTHVKYVNAMQAVTEEEYKDAMQILMASGGVLKSPKGNKMNEIKPHRSWARKIYCKAKAYGVIKDESEYLGMVAREDFA